MLEVDRAAGLVKVEAGIVLGELNRRLDELGLAFENLGDIDRQALAGSISTGTHGTGARFRSVSAQVEAVEMVLADGTTLELSAAGDPAGLACARIGLGALGLIYALTIRTVPAFTLHRVDSPKPLDETLADSTSSTRPTTTSSSTSSRTPTSRSAVRAAAPTSRRGPVRAPRCTPRR